MKYTKALLFAAAIAATAGITTNVQAAEYSDKYTFTFEGTEYTFPISVDTFTKDGWSFFF